VKIKRRPAFFLAAALMTGILSSYLLIKMELIDILKIFIFIEIVYLFFYIFFILNSSKNSIYIWLLILFLILGSVLYSFQEYKYRSNYSCINSADEGLNKVLAEIKFDIGDLESDQICLKPVRINGKKTKYGKIILNSKMIKRFNDGDLVSLELKLNKPTPALNPGAFSYLKYLKKQEIYLQGWDPHNISLLRQKKTFRNLIINIKKIFIKKINCLFSKDKAAFIKAILLGERKYLSYKQESLLRNAGASHLLAISGLHMGILIFTFSFILFKLCSERRNALYLLSILTFIYIIMVGAAISIIRAALLALLFLWSDEFNREGDFLNIISLTLIVNLIIDPSALFSVSLQLSYILVLALFYLTPLFNQFLPVFFAVSVSAQLSSLAVVAYYFNEYSFIALITNLWAIPLITILLPLIFFILIFSFISLNLLKVPVLLVSLGLKILFAGLELMTSIQGKALIIAHPKVIIVIFYYLLLFSLPYVYQKRYINLKARQYRIWRLIVPVLLTIVIISFFINPTSGNLEINYLAVGQGDGILIQFPDGKNMLLDTGPPGSEGRNIEYSIISYLNYLGIRSLDYLMISHFDADHAGGLSHLLQRKNVKSIMIPPYLQKTDLHYQLAAEIDKDSKVNFLTAGMSFKIADCYFKILNPAPDNISEDRNENSIVFLLKYKKRNFLFTGDLSKDGEAKIIKKYNLPEIDILKVGHHGSKSSSGKIMLSQLKPKLAIISVGRNNFGHPAREVINRFNKLKIKYLRTDQQGMIKIISDGQNIKLNTFK